jgi:uncharacterized membrane protein YfcA
VDPDLLVIIATLMAIAAALYTSVGHGGASAYLAIMALCGVSAATMKPTALVLNLIVAGLATIQYLRAGQFNGRLFLAFAATAIPMAFLGGRIELSGEVYRPLLGLALAVASMRLLVPSKSMAECEPRPPSLWVALPVGAAIGLLAGLTGTGGGIFLSPLILLFAWETPRRTSGVAALFILVNSVAGLAGNLSSLRALPAELPWFAGAVLAGALVGTWMGVARLPRQRLLQALGVVLVIASGKLLLTS